ncbi:MAG: hypothetical protein AAGE43_13250 [Pseudomonadota bacterium]
MTVHTIELDGMTLTRVGYLDVPVPAELLGLTPEKVSAISWASPLWADDDQPRLGAAAWFLDIGHRRIVYDPLFALDVLLRADPEAEQTHETAVASAFIEAGFAPDSVDLVIASHIEDVGMIARRWESTGWMPFFPQAQVMLSEPELTAFESGALAPESGTNPTREAWQMLIDEDRVSSFQHGEKLAPGLHADVSGGHSPGHTVLHIGADPAKPSASLIGHLAVTAVHLATGECEALNEDPVAVWSILQATIADGRRLIGPLWPSPGHGSWEAGALRVEN